jgi:hypothetical protein
MSSALGVLYASVKHRIGVDFCTFSELLKYWETIPLYENGELIGCVIRKENELHIGYKKKPTASIRNHLKQTLKKTLNEYGWAKTSVSIDNISGLRFCKRLGFYEIGQEKSKINLKCDRCKYVD